MVALVDLQLPPRVSEPIVFRILERFSQLLVEAKKVTPEFSFGG